MATISVVGARSRLGRALSEQLGQNGHTVRALSTTPPDAVSTDIDIPMYDSVINPTSQSCRQALTGADVVVLAASDRRDLWVAAAVDARVPLVDCASEQHAVSAIYAALKDFPAVVGAGLSPGITDLLVRTAHTRFAASVTTVNTAITFPDRQFPPASAKGSTARRQAIAGTLVHGGMRLLDGEQKPEIIGERREPVWFPRPVGPQFALAWPGISALMLPQVLTELTDCNHYVVVGGWRTEVLQALANMGQRPRGARWLTTRATRPKKTGDPAGLRWACIAELRDGQTFRRAWAYGRDPYTTSAATAAIAVDALLNDEVVSRTSLAGLGSAEQRLDDLTATTGLRWSISEASPDVRF